VGQAVFVCLSAHNLLEGMSILVAAHDGVEKGVRMAAAVSLENVPEGLAIALPILYATRSPRTAVRLALYSGMGEPAGVLLAAAFVTARPGVSQAVVSSLLAVISGILVSLALGQILPLAVKRSSRGRNAELNAWCAVGIIAATIFQPLLMFHGRVGAVR
jgi:zinc transporter, ZIP family